MHPSCVPPVNNHSSFSKELARHDLNPALVSDSFVDLPRELERFSSCRGSEETGPASDASKAATNPSAPPAPPKNQREIEMTSLREPSAAAVSADPGGRRSPGSDPKTRKRRHSGRVNQEARAVAPLLYAS